MWDPLAARVALCLGVLAVPAIVITGPAAQAAARDAATTRTAAYLAAGVHVATLFAATVPMQAWLGTVGAVSHLGALVVPATALAAGAAVAVASISTTPAFLAAASAALAAAFVGAGAAAGSLLLGEIAATVLVLFLVAGFALVPPPPIGFLALTGFLGMLGGCLAYSLASWAVAPRWATDGALAAGGEAVDLAVALQALGGGGAWAFEGDEVASGPLEPPPSPPSPPPPILAAGGELSSPRPPACLRRRPGRGDSPARDPEAAAGAAAAPGTPAAAAAWARVHGAMAAATALRGAARGEGCLGVVAVGGGGKGKGAARPRWCRLLFPQVPLLSSLATHFPTAAATGLADATAAHARLAWTLASLVDGGGGAQGRGGGRVLGGPAGEAVLAVYGRPALAAVGDAAAAAGAAIAAAVPRRFEPLEGGGRGPVAAAELAALEAAVAAVGALHDAGAGAVADASRRGKRKQTQEGDAADAGDPPGAALAALMAAAAAEDGAFLDEVRFAAWLSGLVPLVAALRRVAGEVEGLRRAMPRGVGRRV